MMISLSINVGCVNSVLLKSLWPARRNVYARGTEIPSGVIPQPQQDRKGTVCLMRIEAREPVSPRPPQAGQLSRAHPGPRPHRRPESWPRARPAAETA